MDVTGVGIIGSPESMVLYGAVIVVSILLYLERPRITRWTVLTLVPWMVAASTIPVLAGVGDYPDTVRPLLDASTAYLSTYLILGMAWFGMIEITVDPEARQVLPDYLGAMGVGMATVLITLVILNGEPASVEQLGWSVLILFGVALFAVATVFFLGFWYVDAPTRTGGVGMLAVFGQTLDGVTRSIGIEIFDTASHSLLSWQVLDFVALTQTDAQPSEIAFSWSLTYVWIKVALAVFAVVLLAQQVNRRPGRVYLVLGIIAAMGVTTGMTNLLLIAIGGIP